MTTESNEKDQIVPRCAHVGATPWGSSQCALADGHSDRHAYDPREGQVEDYVARMTDRELAELLDGSARRATGRCVSPPILRAAREEMARRA